MKLSVVVMRRIVPWETGTNGLISLLVIELMIRIRAFEDNFNETRCMGDVYTITLSSRYDYVYSQGDFITKSNGSSPRNTHRYLCRVWARIRAALNRVENHVSVSAWRSRITM